MKRDSLDPDGLFLRGTPSPERPEGSDGLVSRLLLGLCVVVKVHAGSLVPAQLVQGIFSSSCTIFPFLSIHLLDLGRETWLLKGLGGYGPWRQGEVFLELKLPIKDVCNGSSNVHFVLQVSRVTPKGPTL